MANYKTPGVYVEEISTLPASVAQVETAIPAFIGYTEKATKNGESLDQVPTRITALPEYEEYFGGAPGETGILATIHESAPDEDGNTTKSLSMEAPTSTSAYTMWYQMKMYFANGGGPCYVVSVAPYAENGAQEVGKYETALATLLKEDEPTLIVFPDGTGLSQANYDTLTKAAMAQCRLLRDRFAIIDTKAGDNAITDLRTGVGTDNLKYGAAYYPDLKTSLTYNYDDSAVQLDHFMPNDEDGDPVTGALNDSTLADIKDTENDLYNQIKNKISTFSVVLTPSASIAGVYARVDNDRGVWKAPANVSLNNVIAPTLKITNEQQDGLNVDTTAGKSVNAIRSFTGKGVLVWGARTLAGNDNEWRYISVRRFYNMVEESVKKATERVVFEPNDANTWIKSKAQIENFLTNLWRQGALAGAVPEQAFFVNVGIGQTMTAQDILEGRMIIEIGMAVVRPAEFIILRFSHKMQES